MSLYTLYRPRDWDSVIGQDRIKTILQNALTHDRVGHAYLFHGSRGTGKTTSARILAKGVNCLSLRDGNPCHTCANCVAFDNGSMLDVIEIDAASNTGVDNIRDLIEKSRFEPNQGKYKVYIIDEVHMLSTGAFNALLKTLEEPPSHVKFILATTEIDKVPETIRSRTLRFDFRKITEADIISRLQFVIGEEKIQAELTAIQLIAKYARGGLRDALTLLEQNTIDSELLLEHVRMTLSLLEETIIDALIESLRIADTVSVLDFLASLRDMHVGARGFFEQLMYRLRDLMLTHLDDGIYSEYISIYEYIESAYTRVRAIPDGMLLIEVTLLKIVKREDRKENQPTPKKIEVKATVKSEPTKKIERSPETKKNEKIDSPVVQEKPIVPTTPTNILAPTDTSEGGNKIIPFSYIGLLDALKSGKAALVIDLKTARFEQVENHLILMFPKNWNYMRVNTPEMRNFLMEILSERFGGSWTVECHLDDAQAQLGMADDVF